MLTIEKKKKRKREGKLKSSAVSPPPPPPSISSRCPISYPLAWNTILQLPLSTLYSTLLSTLPPLLLYRHSQFAQVTSSRSIQSRQINEIENCLGESQGCFGISERERERARNHKQPQSKPRSRTLSISNFNRKARTTKRRRRRTKESIE